MKAKIWRTVQIVLATLATAVVGFVAYTVTHYLYTSPSFEVKQIQVLGHTRVRETQVLTQADIPDDANIFSVDLDAMRQRVEALQWVRYASVQRVLPDKITIKVFEREPIGLARIGGEIYQFDADATVLNLEPGSAVSFPVLDGLKPKDPEGNRKKVELYGRIVEELQGQSELSEIRINDAGEVAVVPSSEPLKAILGAGDFHKNWIHYLQLRDQIRQLYPDAVEVDFRFSDVIVRMRPDTRDEEKVIWGAEKNSL
jgi:cell division septal protein FtsQ